MRRRSRLLFAITALSALIAASTPASATDPPPCPGSMSGAGTSGSPCLVTNQSQLASIASGLGLTYRLANDITLTGTWSPIAPYPAGATAPFTGVLDGDGYTITGLTTTDSLALAVGLFGITANASISNLHLAGVNVTGSQAVGALIGIADATTIDRVLVSGAINAQTSGVGGLIGYNYRLSGADPSAGGPTTITRSAASSITITTGASGTSAGGLVGIAFQPVSASNSLVSGTISAHDEVGGLAGTSSLVSTDSISTATLTVSAGQTKGGLLPSGGLPATRSFFDTAAAGTTDAGATGGVGKTLSQLKQLATYTGWDIGVGWIPASDIWGICQSPNVKTVPFLNWTLAASPCTPAPPASAPIVTTGAASAVLANSATVSATVNANGDDTSAIAMYTTASATDAASHIGTSHATTPSSAIESVNTTVESALTGLAPNTTYYYWISATNTGGTSTGSVQSFTTPDGPPPLVACSAYDWPGGSGTTSDPYLVDTYIDLYQATQCPDASFRQRADISLALIDNWTPIGDITTQFTGTYDGGHYLITDLTYSSTTGDYVGLFGATDGATIRNINALSGTVLGRASVGGLVGRAMNTTISHVHSSVAVTGDPSARADGSAAAYYIGGLVGYANGGSITGSSSGGSVTATGDGAWSGNNVGGLVGYGVNLAITESWAEGDVRGIIDVGGLAGILLGASSVSRSDASGAVGSPGTSTAGGLIGRIEDSAGSAPVVADAFARGSVTATAGGAHDGGLVGYVDAGTVARAYSTGSVSSTGSSAQAGGFVGSFAGVDAAFADSFWDTTASGQTDATFGGFTTGVTGESTAGMKQLTTFTAAGWDIEATCTLTSTVWAICPTVNGGYPYLQRAPEPGPTPDPTPTPTPTDNPSPGNTGSSQSTTPTPSASPSAEPAVPMPLAPATQLPAGATSASLDGQPITVNAGGGTGTNELQVWGSGFSTTFSGVFSPTLGPRSSASHGVLLSGSTVAISGSGAKPGSSVAIYAFSTPVQLAVLTADADGRYAGSFVVPRSLPLGAHALQVASWTPQSQSLNVSVGVSVANEARMARETVIHFTGRSTKLSKSAAARLTALASALRGAKAVTVTCSAALPAKRVKAGDRELAKQRAKAACAALSARGITAAAKSGAVTTRVGAGLPRGSVRVVASQRISAT